jgi:signal peptidase I
MNFLLKISKKIKTISKYIVATILYIATTIRRGFSWVFGTLFVGPIFPIFLLALILIRLFVFEPFLVYGSSMEPNFETGDYLLVDDITYKFEKPKRGDVIVLQPPFDLSRHFIKRIIGLPNETINVEGSKVTVKKPGDKDGIILNEPYIKFQSDRVSNYTLGPHEYFVMGDNREFSSDSRIWGPVPDNLITGRAVLRVYPLNQMGFFPAEVNLPQ